MASPQKENGYTAIAHEIMEALAGYRIPGEQMQCLLYILRKTYGFNKKWDSISNSQFVKATGLKKPNVCRAIKGLIEKNLVIKKDNSPSINYCFNKNYESWAPLSKKITVIKKDNKSYQKREQLLSKKSTTKVKTNNKTISRDSFPFQLSNLLYKSILENNPNFKTPNLNNWAQIIDLMIRRDKRDPLVIQDVIEWCQQDDFWQNNILSASKLRKQFDQLFMKMIKIKGKKKEQSPYNFPECQNCGQRASNIKKGKNCPICGKIA